MRALVVEGPGSEPELREVPDPEPGPGDVRVRVAAVSVNRIDLLLLRGAAPPGTPYPIVPGLDPVGDVDAVGSGVDPDLVGRRVAVKPNLACGACRPCREGADDACERGRIFGVHRDGGWAELVVVPAAAALPAPPGVDPAAVTAAVHSLPVAARLLARCDLSRADAVLVLGAAGAIGDAAVQLARLAGARVVGVVSTAGKAAHVRGRGADEVLVVDRAQGPHGLAERLRAVLPHGADVMVDAAADRAVWAEVLPTLAPRARVGVCGTLAGRTVELDLLWLYRNRTAILGSAGARRSDVLECLRLVGEGLADTPVSARLPLGDWAEARALAAERDRVGKVVLDVG